MTQIFKIIERSFADTGVDGGLAKAVAAENILAIKLYLTVGQNIDARDNHGMTLLQIAAAEGKKNSVAALLRFGANPNLTGGPAGYTAAHFAVYSDNHVALTLIARASQNIDLRDLSGQTPLHLAAYTGRAQCCFNLLRHGADFTAKNSQGHTAKEIVLQRINELSEWQDKAQYQPLARMFASLEDAGHNLRGQFLDSCILDTAMDIQSLDFSQALKRSPRRIFTRY